MASIDEKPSIGQQERINDLTLGLSETACEATGLHHQGATSHMMCCNTYHLSHAYTHTDTKQKMLLLMNLASVLL